MYSLSLISGGGPPPGGSLTKALIPWPYLISCAYVKSRNGDFIPLDKLVDMFNCCFFFDFGDHLMLNPVSTVPMTGDGSLVYLNLWTSYEIYGANLPALASSTLGDAISYCFPTRDPVHTTAGGFYALLASLVYSFILWRSIPL